MLKYINARIIDVADWDELVQKTYNKPYRFQQQDGCKPRGMEYMDVPPCEWELYDFENDSLPEQVNGEKRGVSFKAWLERDPNLWKDDNQSNLTLFWLRNFYPHISMLIKDLYEKGLIEKGEYLLEVDW